MSGLTMQTPAYHELRAALLMKGLTLAGLAREVGVSRQRMYRAARDPSPKVARRCKVIIARRLGTRIASLWPEPTNGKGAA